MRISATSAFFTPSTIVTLADIDLGSEFANKLGLSGISKWDGTLEASEDITTQSSSNNKSATGVNGQSTSDQQDEQGGGKKKKKNNKKKKKKK